MSRDWEIDPEIPDDALDLAREKIYAILALYRRADDNAMLGEETGERFKKLARNVLNPAVPRHRFIHFPARSAFFLCEHHDRLTGNVNFQDNLLHLLLSIDH